jgi:chondroitin 4-sulfotransferase 11
VILILKEKLKEILYGRYPYRYYMNKKKCIFIHIPKSAGTSILTSLAENKRIFRDHATWRDFYNFNQNKFKRYYKFTFVRNPFDRLVSTYSYLLAGGNQNQDIYFKDYFIKNNITFELFVLDYLDSSKIFEHMIYAPQYLFVYDFQYKLRVDYVGKFENIEKDFINVSKSIRGLTPLKKLNSSSRKDKYLEYYSNKRVVEKVVNLYKKDFEFFCYSKTPPKKNSLKLN